MKLSNIISKITRKQASASATMDLIAAETERQMLLIGRGLANQVCAGGIYQDLHQAEFKVFSQFGDDGILQYLIDQVKPESHTFIEFGVQDYFESNTRFLLMNNNWRGLIIDGDRQAMAALKLQDYYWRNDLTAVGEFITRDNINQLFTQNGFSGEIGLLSVDIDGNDYWVWESIDSVNPLIVVVEYNSVFGPKHAVSVPYDPAFVRTKAHYSNLFWGASLKAFDSLARKKGYVFVGCNSAGNNAYFIRKDRVGKIPVVSVEDGYVESHFRESRDAEGNLTFLRGSQRFEAIQEMQVVDVTTGSLIPLRDLA